MPFLSVIVPVYNVKDYLAACLDSILAQTFTDFEVILVDDGSTDGSSVICDAYAKKDSRIRCVHKENGGLVSARQEGFRHIAGTYATFVDSDDWIAADMYEKMCGAAKETDADVICCNYISAAPDKKIERRDFCAPGLYDKRRLTEEIYPQMLLSGSFFHFGISPSLCNKIFRKSLLGAHLFQVPLSIKLGEDGLATYPCLLHADSVRFLSDSLYFYRSTGSSLTHTMDSRRLTENRLLFDIFEELIDLSAYPCMERQLHCYYVYQCLLTFPPVFRTACDAGHHFREAFLAECGYPPVKRAFRAVRIREISGLHNKAYALCIRHRLYRLFRFFLTH